MGVELSRSKMTIISGIILLAAYPAWAQQTAPQAAPPPPAAPKLAPQPLLGGGAGGYGAAPMFSPFPRDGAILPPSLQVPGLKPESGAPREYSLTLGAEGRERFSNNVYSTSSPTKSDFVTSANASVATSADSRRIKGAARYGLGFDKYATYSEMDGIRFNGIGVVDAELLENRLFLNVRNSASEQSISQTGQGGDQTGQNATERTSAGNTVRVYSGSIAPRVQHRFGDLAIGQASYHHDETHYQNASRAPSASSPPLASANLNKSVTDGGRIEVRSGESFTRMIWDYTGDADHEETKGRTFDQVTHTLGSEYRLSSDFGLLAAVGSDYLHSNSVDLRKYGGAFYTGGLHWTPSPDMDVRIGIGQRYDKTNWIVLAAYWLGPSTVARVSSDSGVTTDALSFERSLNAVQRDATGGFVNPFSGLEATPSATPFNRTSSIYWQRNTDFVLRHDEVRDSFALSVRIAEQRIIDSPAIPATVINSGSATVMGAHLSWRHHFTPVISGLATVSQFDTVASSNTLGRFTQRKGSLGLNYNMNPTLLGTFGYNVSTASPTPTGTIREDMLTVGLQKTF
jgi:uncharacterized protein (PEP-CTERM system associated)